MRGSEFSFYSSVLLPYSKASTRDLQHGQICAGTGRPTVQVLQLAKATQFSATPIPELIPEAPLQSGWHCQAKHGYGEGSKMTVPQTILGSQTGKLRHSKMQGLAKVLSGLEPQCQMPHCQSLPTLSSPPISPSISPPPHLFPSPAPLLKVCCCTRIHRSPRLPRWRAGGSDPHAPSERHVGPCEHLRPESRGAVPVPPLCNGQSPSLDDLSTTVSTTCHRMCRCGRYLSGSLQAFLVPVVSLRTLFSLLESPSLSHSDGGRMLSVRRPRHPIKVGHDPITSPVRLPLPKPDTLSLLSATMR